MPFQSSFLGKDCLANKLIILFLKGPKLRVPVRKKHWNLSIWQIGFAQGLCAMEKVVKQIHFHLRVPTFLIIKFWQICGLPASPQNSRLTLRLKEQYRN